MLNLTLSMIQRSSPKSTFIYTAMGAWFMRTR